MSISCKNTDPVRAASWESEPKDAKAMHYRCDTASGFNCRYGKFAMEVIGHSNKKCIFIATAKEISKEYNGNLQVKTEITMDYSTESGWVKNNSMKVVQYITPQNMVSYTMADFPEADGDVGKVDFKSIKIWIESVNPVEEYVSTTYPETHVTLLSMLNVPSYSDVSLITEGTDVVIKASRIVLSQTSKFFHAMFGGNWSETTESNEPIKLAFSTPAVFLCLLHIYGGWYVGEELPALDNVTDLMDEIGFVKDDLEFELISEVARLAEMLELRGLVVGAMDEMIMKIQDMKAKFAN